MRFLLVSPRIVRRNASYEHNNAEAEAEMLHKVMIRSLPAIPFFGFASTASAKMLLPNNITAPLSPLPSEEMIPPVMQGRMAAQPDLILSTALHEQLIAEATWNFWIYLALACSSPC